MANLTFAEQTQLGSERTYTSQVGFARTGIYVFFGLLNVAAALLEWCFPGLPFLPHPVASLIFSLPLFFYAALYKWLRTYNKVALCSAGIRWRNREILWENIISAKESNHGLLTLEIKQAEGWTRIPISGMQDLKWIRETISKHADHEPLSLPIHSPSARTVFFCLSVLTLELCSYLLLFKAVQYYGSQIPGLSETAPMGLTWIAIILSTSTIIQPYYRSRIGLSSKLIVDKEGISEQILTIFKKRINFKEITSLHWEPETTTQAEGLRICSEANSITLDSHFPNYPQIVTRICKEIGLEVKDA